MADRVEIRGATQLASTLRRAVDHLADMRSANEAAAAIIAAAAALRAPRLTGRLANSITGAAVKGAAQVYSDEIYAPPIHNGWPAHHIAPQPFITQGADDSEADWLAVLDHGAQHELDQVKGA
jgi:hypothetical protein